MDKEDLFEKQIDLKWQGVKTILKEIAELELKLLVMRISKGRKSDAAS